MDELELLLKRYEIEEKERPPADYRIMIIDDDPGIRRALRKTFSRRGYEPVEFRTGEEAVEYLSREAEIIKAVILDVKLPKIDGNQIYRMIKEIIDIPIIIHTAYAAEDAPDSRSLNAFDYIHKGTPESYERLCSAVERAVGWEN